MKTKSNRTEDIMIYINNELKNIYSPNEIKALSNILFKEYAGINTAHLLAFKDEVVNESELLKIINGVKRLKKHEPIQYILGMTEFCGLNISVNRHVLIPRPETEEMTLSIIKENQRPNLSIIDLCTGSGCIALALNKFIPSSRVFGIDISDMAIAVAQKNNTDLHLNATFHQMDLLTLHQNVTKGRLASTKGPSTLTKGPFVSTKRPLAETECQTVFEQQFDIIVSNPPYVTQSERSEMEKNVLDYEPEIALFVDDENPLVFYEKIAFFAANHLKNDGKLYLEINCNFANDILSLFPSKEYVAEVRFDIFNRPRFIFLQKFA